MLYTYQTQTVAPVFMAHSAASSTELIEAAHVLPHGPVPSLRVTGPDEAQALCGIQYDKSHGSLTKREMRATGNNVEPDKHRLMHTRVRIATIYTQHASWMDTSAAAP